MRPSLLKPLHLVPALAFCVILSLRAAPPPESAPPDDGPGGFPIPKMEATGAFFSGAVVVNVHFGRMERPRKDAPGADGKPSANAPAGKGGGKRKGAGKGGPPPGGGGRGGGDPSERTPNIREERNPPTQFRLSLTNAGKEPLVVEVLDFDSLLGNFAVKPDKITIAPGATVEADPMISRLGIPTEDLPLKIRMRTGGVRGTPEQQTLMLKIQKPPPPEN